MTPLEGPAGSVTKYPRALTVNNTSTFETSLDPDLRPANLTEGFIVAVYGKCYVDLRPHHCRLVLEMMALVHREKHSSNVSAGCLSSSSTALCPCVGQQGVGRKNTVTRKHSGTGSPRELTLIRSACLLGLPRKVFAVQVMGFLH